MPGLNLDKISPPVPRISVEAPLRKFQILGVALIALACSPAQNKTEKDFAEIVSGFPIVRLPAKFIDYDRKIEPITSSTTRAFVSGFKDSTYITLWGRVYPNETNYFLVGTVEAGRGEPYLMCFDTEGKKISGTLLLSGEYIAGLEAVSSNECILSENMQYVETDSVFERSLNTDSSDWIPGTETCRLTVRRFQIQKNGDVVLLSTDTSKFKTGQ